MRLWHEALIPYLPRQQLLGLHREVCALRGLGWGKKHATVDYVFQHPYGWLVAYHYRVIAEMMRRGYTPSTDWLVASYRGRSCEPHVFTPEENLGFTTSHPVERLVYPEHNDAYLQECLDNLAGKGIKIDMEVKP